MKKRWFLCYFRDLGHPKINQKINQKIDAKTEAKPTIFRHGGGAKKPHLSRVLLRRGPQKDTCRRTPQRGRVCERWSAREPDASTPREPPARGGFLWILGCVGKLMFFRWRFGSPKNQKNRALERPRGRKVVPNFRRVGGGWGVLRLDGPRGGLAHAVKD